MTMYVAGNPKTKAALKRLLAEGRRPEVFSAGIGRPVKDGVETVSGPQYPEPHSWYARVKTEDGRIVKVLS